MLAALDHPEIVEAQAAVLEPQQTGGLLLQPVALRVVGDDGIVVDHQMDVVAAQAFPLHIVDPLVTVQGVFPVVHLHMEAGVALAGAVVMDHEIVIAQHQGLGFHIVHDLPPQVRVGVFSQQGGDGIPCQVPAAV